MSRIPFKIQDSRLFPARIQETIENYVNHGGDLSGFWLAMFSGDYEAAALNADEQNSTYFVSIIRFMVSSAPYACFGSPARVKKWRSSFVVRP